MLSINIETIADPDLDQRLVPTADDVSVGNRKDPEKIAEYRKQKEAELRAKMCLSPLTGKIIALGYRFGDHESHSDVIVSENEGDILHEFASVCAYRIVTPPIVTFNGKNFDIPFLRVAFLRHAIPVPNVIRSDRYDDHLDIFRLFGERHSLSDWSIRLFGTERFGDGSMVGEWWERGERQSIKRHCQANVDIPWTIAKNYFSQIKEVGF